MPDLTKPRPFRAAIMRCSIVIPAYNEGALLARTIDACLETCGNLEHEIIVADDASTDGTVAAAGQRFPGIRIVRSRQQQGVAATKHAGALAACGDVLVFLDAHCKPEDGCLERLVGDVETRSATSVVTPAVLRLDPAAWTNDPSHVGNGYRLKLDDLTWGWLERGALRANAEHLESPCLIGCCLAVARTLYQELWGFDSDMTCWGVEDVEFGVKAWLLGHPILHQPEAVVGHRFHVATEVYPQAEQHIAANQLRMAYKIFSSPVWLEWLARFRGTVSPRVWDAAWSAFCARRGSAERERSYLMQHRVHDEFWYAERFGLSWPKRS
ncbi:MAG: glycosyltransferase [Pirellulales bacterium]